MNLKLVGIAGAVVLVVIGIATYKARAKTGFCEIGKTAWSQSTVLRCAHRRPWNNEAINRVKWNGLASRRHIRMQDPRRLERAANEWDPASRPGPSLF